MYVPIELIPQLIVKLSPVAPVYITTVSGAQENAGEGPVRLLVGVWLYIKGWLIVSEHPTALLTIN